jgi:Allophanate hydrolase C-terminal domain
MDTILLAVNGTLMRGLELNQNLLDVGAEFVEETTTAPSYRLWTINDVHPAMQRFETGGREIDLELWQVPVTGVSHILMQEPPGLCIGKVKLADDRTVLGVLGEAALCLNQTEITEFGGWRQYCDQSH